VAIARKRAAYAARVVVRYLSRIEMSVGMPASSITSFSAALPPWAMHCTSSSLQLSSITDRMIVYVTPSPR
jgi:hypothetical protein